MRIRTLAQLTGAVLLPLAAVAADMPQRKSGLWEVKTSIASMPAQAMQMQQCIDQGTDDAMRAMAGNLGQQSCSKLDVRRDGARFVSDSVCKFRNSTITSRGVFSGDFSSGYKAEINTSYDPPMMGRKNDTTLIEARWVGPCKAGMKPGDMVMPGGKVLPGSMMMKGATK